MDGRTVTLVLLDRDGRALGALDPIEVELPWWQDAASIVAAAITRRGFLDQIEPSEHPYHRDDPALWLRRVAGLV